MNPSDRSPLAGVEVLELGHMVAGPMCTQILADCGARVHKVEPGGRDIARDLGPGLPDGSSGVFAAINRHKHLIGDDGTDLAARLASADVLVSNVTPKVLRRHGVEPEALAARYPQLIQVRISSSGPGGPPGTDSLAQAATGLSRMTGPAEGPAYRVGAPVVDVAAGVWAALAVVLALRDRDRAGRGAIVEISLTDVCLHLQAPFLAAFEADPTRIRRRGNESHLACAPALQAADGIVVVVMLHDGHWSRFCAVLGQDGLADDPRFRTDASRVAHQAEIAAAAAPTFEGSPAADWIDRLSRAGVPCSLERDYHDVLTDPALWSSGALYRDEAPYGDLASVALPIVVDGARLHHRSGAHLPSPVDTTTP